MKFAGDLIGTLSEKSKSVMVYATYEAQRSESERVKPIHVLVALLAVEIKSGKYRVRAVLEKLGCAIETLLQDAKRQYVRVEDSTMHSSHLARSPETLEMLMCATALSVERECCFVHTDHILYGLAVCAEKNPVDEFGMLFARHGISAMLVKDEIKADYPDPE